MPTHGRKIKTESFSLESRIPLTLALFVALIQISFTLASPQEWKIKTEAFSLDPYPSSLQPLIQKTISFSE
jgi:hypothetical protein